MFQVDAVNRNSECEVFVRFPCKLVFMNVQKDVFSITFDGRQYM